METEYKKPTIDDLLSLLQSPNKPGKKQIQGSFEEIWSRIGKKDDFAELGLDKSELDSFLSEWISENPYSN